MRVADEHEAGEDGLFLGDYGEFLGFLEHGGIGDGLYYRMSREMKRVIKIT